MHSTKYLWRSRLQRLDYTSDALLYASLLLGEEWLAIGGAALSPLLWMHERVTKRHIALLFAVLVVQLAGTLAFLDAWIGQSQNLVAITPSFVLRPSFVAILVLLPDRSALRAGLLNVLLASAFVGTAQVLAIQHTDLQTLGFVFLGVTILIEAVNAWALWNARERPASTWRLSAAVVAAGAVIAIWVPPLSSQPGSIAIWWPTDPHAEFATVDQGYGWANIGNLGELPKLLGRAGYSISHVNTFDDLNTQALIMPVPFRSLAEGEINRIREYVRSGGRLFLIGEHTNLDSVRDNFNAVLNGTGISLRFDTTNALFGDSTFALKGAYVSSNPYLTHNRGASILINRPGPQPLLVGSWWHSDFGDALAPERGYLNDYHVSVGDRVGNLVLAARASFGDGHIIAWGDGSPFLNQNLIYNSRFILSHVRDLVGEARGSWSGPLAAIVLALIWFLTRRTEIVALAALIGLFTSLVGSADSALPQPLAVVSNAENNGFDRDPFSGRSVTGLGVWLTRAGYVPWIGDWRTLSAPPKVLFVINPNRWISDAYAARLRSLAETGTTVFIGGGGDNPSFTALARHFGVAPVGAPIGSVAGDEFTTYSAWKVSSTAGRALTANSVPIGTVTDVGKGRIVIIADSGFFLSRNLETETEYDLKNQRFLEASVAAP